jgi:hypothetical protein
LDPARILAGTDSQYLFLFIKQREQPIMVRSKPKREKREETTAEFVKRINEQGGKRNGLKKQLKGARR